MKVIGAASQISEFWPSVAEHLIYDDVLYFAMENDTKRMEHYRRALTEHARGKVVLDIGTGPKANLAALALDSGARHVYAVEYLASAYQKAKAFLRSHSLENRITLYHGDARNVSLPEKADVCVSALVGSIGSLEGVVPVLNSVRQRLLKPDAVMIPQSSITEIAAITLPDNLKYSTTFAVLPARYVKILFTQAGKPYDLRLCIRNFPRTCFLSTVGICEALRFQLESDVAYLPQRLELEILQDGTFDGFLAWLVLTLAKDVRMDILRETHCLLPLYLPVLESGIEVKRGDKIVATCLTEVSENNVNPNYRITGDVLSGCRKIPFRVNSEHRAKTYGSSALYERLLRSF